MKISMFNKIGYVLVSVFAGFLILISKKED